MRELLESTERSILSSSSVERASLRSLRIVAFSESTETAAANTPTRAIPITARMTATTATMRMRARKLAETPRRTRASRPAPSTTSNEGRARRWLSAPSEASRRYASEPVYIIDHP